MLMIGQVGLKKYLAGLEGHFMANGCLLAQVGPGSIQTGGGVAVLQDPVPLTKLLLHTSTEILTTVVESCGCLAVICGSWQVLERAVAF